MFNLEFENLKSVIYQKKIQPFYQIIVDKNKKVVGIEILSRWIEQDGQLFSPDVFIDKFDKHGLLPELTCILIEQIIETMPTSNNKDMFISININEDIISDFKFKYYIKYLSTYYNIVLEVTESKKIQNKQCFLSDMSELRSEKIKFSIDDYGKENSTLSLLYDYNFDMIKLDKFFITDLFIRDNGQELSKKTYIINNIVALCSSLNIKLIAEGVETISQEEFLKKNGVAFFQGYLYSKPSRLERHLP
ncbi:EAL domain-containing protein [Photobacterium damselae]